MAMPREQVEAKAILHTTSPTPALLSIGSRYERLDKPRELSAFIKSIGLSADINILKR
jgi:hypothetical protein